MYSDHDLSLHLSETRALIESEVSTTIWRTAIRIHELIRIKFPHAKYNEGIVDEVKYAQVLAALCDEEELMSREFASLDGEYYEEGHHEPILLGDTQILKKGKTEIVTFPAIAPAFQRINVRGIIVQRELHRLMKEGYDFQIAASIVHELDGEVRDAYVRQFRAEGMSRGTIFYKKRTPATHTKGEQEIPMIPELLS